MIPLFGRAGFFFDINFWFFFVPDHGAESDGTVTDVDEILDLGDYHRKLGQDKKLDRKRAKAETNAAWETKVEDCLKPSPVVIPR